VYNIGLITVLKNQCVIFTRDFYGVGGGADNILLITSDGNRSHFQDR